MTSLIRLLSRALSALALFIRLFFFLYLSLKNLAQPDMTKLRWNEEPTQSSAAPLSQSQSAFPLRLPVSLSGLLGRRLVD